MAAKYNLLEDLQKITTIPMTSLLKLEKKSIALMCDYMDSSLARDDKKITVNIGIGTLIFIVGKNENDDDTINYKFIPSPEFEKSIINTFIDGQNPFVEMLNEDVCKQVLGMYKNLL